MRRMRTRAELDASYKRWEDHQWVMNGADDLTPEQWKELERRSIVEERAWDAALVEVDENNRTVARTMLTGWLFRWGSMWIGAHWAPHNKRLCINVVPFVTFWITFKGGVVP